MHDALVNDVGTAEDCEGNEYLGTPDSLTHSAIIRALRDWLVTEEPEPYMPDYPDTNQAAPWLYWNERQRLRALLTAEAERAEGTP
jgi:hypothetical protein